MPDGSDQLTIARQYWLALNRSAKAKVEAMKAKKIAERTYDRVFLSTEGKNLDERKAKARLDEKFIVAEDAAIEAESEAIVAKAKADALEVGFEEWRTAQATTRAEMNLR